MVPKEGFLIPEEKEAGESGPFVSPPLAEADALIGLARSLPWLKEKYLPFPPPPKN